jgi:hypothetical protein
LRRLSAFLIVLGLCALALPGIVSAAKQVTFKAAVVPIVGFPHTGNVLGAGAALQIEYTTAGTDSPGGLPHRLTGVNLYLPTGFRVHPSGFPTCGGEEVQREKGPIGCPKGSAAGPAGQVLVGGEEGTIESFYLPGDELEFFTLAHNPEAVEIYTRAHFVNLAAGGGFGPEMIAEVGRNFVGPPQSTEKVSMELGSAYRTDGRAHYYLTLPKKCPRGGFPLKAELEFTASGEESQAYPHAVASTFQRLALRALAEPLRWPCPVFSMSCRRARRGSSFEICRWSVTPARWLICLSLSLGTAAIAASTLTVR